MDVFTQCQYRNVFLDRIFLLQQQRQTWSPSACQKMLRAFLSGVFRVMRCARNPTVKFSGKLVKTVDSDALSLPNANYQHEGKWNCEIGVLVNYCALENPQIRWTTHANLSVIKHKTMNALSSSVIPWYCMWSDLVLSHRLRGRTRL